MSERTNGPRPTVPGDFYVSVVLNGGEGPVADGGYLIRDVHLFGAAAERAVEAMHDASGLAAADRDGGEAMVVEVENHRGWRRRYRVSCRLYPQYDAAELAGATR